MYNYRMTQNFLKYVILDLLLNSNYKTDRARARKLAADLKISESTAQTKISRARRRLDSLSAAPGRSRDASKRISPPTTTSYYIYCIECINPSHFYIGQSRNIAERLRSHERGDAAFIQ